MNLPCRVIKERKKGVDYCQGGCDRCDRTRWTWRLNNSLSDFFHLSPTPTMSTNNTPSTINFTILSATYRSPAQQIVIQLPALLEPRPRARLYAALRTCTSVIQVPEDNVIPCAESRGRLRPTGEPYHFIYLNCETANFKCPLAQPTAKVQKNADLTTWTLRPKTEPAVESSSGGSLSEEICETANDGEKNGAQRSWS